MLCFVQGKVPSQQVHVMRELQTMQLDLNARAFVKFASIVKKATIQIVSVHSVKIIKDRTKTTYSGRQGELTRQSPVTASCTALMIVYLMKHTGGITTWQAVHMHCSKVVHKDFIMNVQRFTQI